MKGGKYLEKKMFCPWRRRRTEKEKEENILRRKSDDRQTKNKIDI